MLATWGTSTGRNPTLDLQFAGATSLDNRITFSRGSQATLFDSTGALVYAKHNLVLYSQKLDDAVNWALTGAGATITATTDIAAPNGTLTAWTLTSSGATAQIQQAITGQVSASYTGSFWIRRRSGTGTINIRVSENVNTPLAGVTSDWQRFNFSATSTTSTIRLGISLSGTSDAVDIWGAQLNLTPMEGGVTSSLSTYYPTVASAYYAPRFDYNPSTLAAQGLLIEEQRTNSIRNNTMQGAVAGTPGTLPTNWATTTGGLAIDVAGVGTESGIAYVDLRFNGTSTGTVANVRFEQNTQIVAASGQAWTNSVFIRRSAGSTANITLIENVITGRDSGGTTLETFTSSIAATLNAAVISQNRQTLSATLANALTARIVGQINLTFSVGVAIDITLRIGLPQLEQGAFATSVIPTTTTALTRNADVASMTGTNFSSWFNASEGTIFSQSVVSRQVAIAGTGIVLLDGGAPEIIRLFYRGTGATAFGVTDNSVTQCDLTPTGVLAANAVAKLAGAYKLDDFATSGNGGAVTTDPTGTLPTVNQLTLGFSSVYLNGWIQRISYYPVRLPNSTLQALTA